MFGKVLPLDVDLEEPTSTIKIRLRDICIVVIGQGPVAKRLVERRRAAGGRVCLLWTQETPQGFVEAAHPRQQPCAGGAAEPTWDLSTFAWKPPREECSDDRALSMLKKQFGSALLDWRSSGPLLVYLHAGEAYKVVCGDEGQSWGVQVVDTEHPDMPVRWEISGIVIFAGIDVGQRAAGLEVCPDEASAIQADVAVLREEALPFATICPKHAALWVPLYLVQYLTYYLLMGIYESGMRPGDIPWWRGSFTALVIMPIGYSAFPDFMGVALTGRPVSNLTARLAVAVTYLFGQIASAVVPLGWHGGEWCGLPIFMAVSLAFLPYLLLAAPLHVVLTRPARANGQGCGKLPWRSHIIWLSWMIFGTFGTWVVLYCVALFYIAALKWNKFLASLALPMLTSAVELGTVIGTMQLYNTLVYLPRVKVSETGEKSPVMLGDQRELVILPISITHAYAEATRLVSLLVSTVTEPNWFWVAQLLGCFFFNISLRSTLLTEFLTRAMPAKWWCLLAPDSGTILHNEAKLCFGYPRFISLATLAIANLILSHGSCWPLFNMHATLLVVSAGVLEMLEDVVVTGRLASAMTWRRRMANFYRGEEPFGNSQIMGYDRDGVQWNSPAIGFSGMRFVRSRVVVVAMAASSFFPYTLLTLLLGAGFVHRACESPISEENRLLDGLVWLSPLRC
mmetsp:Transcript_125944/g.305997  ORF Transcript_125944/g.305997 Transcript_125944/m.305997 type:complete len:680 (-) Transcript_125944:184-2223(-)